jgi:MFS family permease
MPANARKYKILLYSNNLWNFADGMLGPLFAVFTEKIGGNVLDISWAWAIYLFVTGVLIIFVGKISDRVSKKKLMIAGYALTAVFTFSYLLVTQPWHLFLVQAGLGVAIALCNPPWYALYAKYSDNNNPGYAWGLQDGEAKIMTGLAVIIGGAIVYYFSFAALFIVMGIIETVTAIYLIQIFQD